MSVLSILTTYSLVGFGLAAGFAAFKVVYEAGSSATAAFLEAAKSSAAAEIKEAELERR